MPARFENKVVWITGGGTGLGLALAKAFAAEGAHVAVSGRRKDRLDEAVAAIEAVSQEQGGGGEALAVRCDVTDEASVAAAVEEVVGHFGRLDVAVANAGFGVGGRILELSADDWRRQFDTNVVGLAMTARYAIPHLEATGGRLALIGSVAGTLGLPGSGAYSASKAAVRTIGQTLSVELVGTGVSCTTIQPGFVESEIGRVDNEGVFREEWRDRRPAMLMWRADRAARVMLDAIYQRRREFTFTIHGKLTAFLGSHAPGFANFTLRMVGRR